MVQGTKREPENPIRVVLDQLVRLSLEDLRLFQVGRGVEDGRLHMRTEDTILHWRGFVETLLEEVNGPLRSDQSLEERIKEVQQVSMIQLRTESTNSSDADRWLEHVLNRYWLPLIKALSDLRRQVVLENLRRKSAYRGF